LPIDKGSSLLLGKFGFSSRGGDLYNNSSGDRNTLIQFTPSFGYFIARGLMLGVELNLLMQSQGSYSNTNWSIGPALMYFIGGNDSKHTLAVEFAI
jgi:hypothetical protein